MKYMMPVLLVLLLAAACGDGGGGGDGGEVPDVSGVYFLDQPAVVQSNCDVRLNARFVDPISQLDGCAFEVEQVGERVTVESCNGTVYRGSVNNSGQIRAQAITAVVLEEGCAVTDTGDLSVEAPEKGSLARVESSLDFADDCIYFGTGERIRDCSLVSEAGWG